MTGSAALLAGAGYHAPTMSNPDPARDTSQDHVQRIRAGVVSLVGGTVIFTSKVVAWRLTGSTAVLSDALESTVNVVAAIFAVFALRFAAQPPDRDHPYGHGKIEFLAAGFEGGLVAFAALMILYSAGRALVVGPELRRLDVGLAVSAVAGVANFALGSWLVRQGKRYDSPTLIADGTHVLSDVWTTAGVLLGLLLVKLTGITLLDPIAAIVVALLLARAGVKLVRESTAALLDQEDPELLERLVAGWNAAHVEGLGSLHRLRAIRSGNIVHVDAHVFVPEHWTVRQAHDATEKFEQMLMEITGIEGEIVLHLDPCHTAPCTGCDLPDCATRVLPFEGRAPLTVEQAVSVTGVNKPPEGRD